MFNKENAKEKATIFVAEHPVASTGLLYGIGLIVAIPVTILSYKFFGKCTGKEVAKELLKNGATLVIK